MKRVINMPKTINIDDINSVSSPKLFMCSTENGYSLVYGNKDSLHEIGSNVLIHKKIVNFMNNKRDTLGDKEIPLES